MGGPDAPFFIKIYFVILTNMMKKLVAEGGVINKVLKSSSNWANISQELQQSYTISFVFFIFVLALARQWKPFFSLKPLDDVINCGVFT